MVTVFVPVNSAFDALAQQMNSTVPALLTQTNMLAQVMVLVDCTHRSAVRTASGVERSCDAWQLARRAPDIESRDQALRLYHSVNESLLDSSGTHTAVQATWLCAVLAEPALLLTTAAML